MVIASHKTMWVSGDRATMPSHCLTPGAELRTRIKGLRSRSPPFIHLLRFPRILCYLSFGKASLGAGAWTVPAGSCEESWRGGLARLQSQGNTDRAQKGAGNERWEEGGGQRDSEAMEGNRSSWVPVATESVEDNMPSSGISGWEHEMQRAVGIDRVREKSSPRLKQP